jgi:hypothetical protein
MVMYVIDVQPLRVTHGMNLLSGLEKRIDLLERDIKTYNNVSNRVVPPPGS